MFDDRGARSAAVIVAAGRGTRTGHAVPKQYLFLGGRPVLCWTLERFLDHPAISDVVVVIHPDDRDHYETAVSRLPPRLRGRLLEPVAGGATRQVSVYRGLEALAAGRPPGHVMIHDAARPFVTDALIAAAHEAGLAQGAAIPGIRVTDTIKSVDGNGQVVGTPQRDALRAVQTPQAFHFAELYDAHARAHAGGRHDFTDDGALAEWAGLAVHVFDGDPGNMKLTTADDVTHADLRLAHGGVQLRTRTGLGYDVHAFGPGDHVWLGGVRIPHEAGVVAHSDGDVALHALTDAVLGALADGDIGVHFPPSDARWKDASSDQFLAYAIEKVARRGGVIDHLDVAIVCEAPKVGPHREAIRQRIAEIAGVEPDCVSVKATTSERLGFVGRREGLSAQAIATIRLP